jgi:hypothetical protein
MDEEDVVVLLEESCHTFRLRFQESRPIRNVSPKWDKKNNRNNGMEGGGRGECAKEETYHVRYVLSELAETSKRKYESYLEKKSVCSSKSASHGRFPFRI